MEAFFRGNYHYIEDPRKVVFIPILGADLTAQILSEDFFLKITTISKD